MYLSFPCIGSGNSAPSFTRSLHVHNSAFLLIRTYVSCREKHIISIERSDIDGLVDNGVKQHNPGSSSSGQLYIC